MKRRSHRAFERNVDCAVSSLDKLLPPPPLLSATCCCSFQRRQFLNAAELQLLLQTLQLSWWVYCCCGPVAARAMAAAAASGDDPAVRRLRRRPQIAPRLAQQRMAMKRARTRPPHRDQYTHRTSDVAAVENRFVGEGVKVVLFGGRSQRVVRPEGRSEGGGGGGGGGVLAVGGWRQ
ncbi:hypothetical protein DFJ73DRAFT_862002 [Zopfochytrium polystomum]|nr:hypothetical protein DFJ73DRAFT_862002 [Zopfochytrium polystomum]